MAHATKRLDPFAARLLSIRLQQKRVAGIKTDPARTDTCCSSPGTLNSDSDEDDALGCNEPAFGIGPVSTGCKDCGEGPLPPPLEEEAWRKKVDDVLLAPGGLLDGIISSQKATQAHVELLEIRIASLEQTRLKNDDRVGDTGDLP